ncbi:hypothetical protein C457_14279 [Haloferax prahovense DSM 18310]|uniref:Uncharacterized protein n=1 Tax=Haloferax prahovense (strain DSM 18310 / JCM 13924 / TL6) TaxID=1227461 RepID=M0G8N2_HALPT|nr:hypothetical protein [Haloferax prahovense]ELZ67209.1 hypothetical protein C457_14279 [Haloferax prahovense DSM 18310]
MTPLQSVVLAFLGAWVGATVGNSTRIGASALSQRLGPLYAIVPKWNFFSPHPGQHDYVLLYRDRRTDGSLSAWRSVDKLSQSAPPAIVRWVWNPSMYRSKALFDLTQGLTSAFDDDEQRADSETEVTAATPPEPRRVDLGQVKFSTMYLTLLQLVTAQEHSPLGESTQFAVMQYSRASDGHELVFASEFHSLDD